tara:strand:+ start:12716 stop:13069 length:354 start_codon:yes stop_codon:yes gene_type:complete
MKNYKICIDLDGTICENKSESIDYRDVKPIKDAVKSIQKLKSEGHYIIIFTARNMATYNNNIGKVIANQSKIVIDWLDEHNVPYDELHFGKPVADFYIDDKAYKFENWNQVIDDINI